MKKLRPWVRLPTEWIEGGGLKPFKWKPSCGGDLVAALMTLIVVAHHAEDDTGTATLTYEDLTDAASLSRAKVANGLEIIEAMGLVQRKVAGRSTFVLANYTKDSGWGKLPAQRLYSASGRINAFSHFTLRSRTELNALKLYLLFVARRGNDTNMAHISFDKIMEYTDIVRGEIRPATGFLAAHSLAYPESIPSRNDPHRSATAYRLVGVDSYNHPGTRGRGFDYVDFGEDG